MTLNQAQIGVLARTFCAKHGLDPNQIQGFGTMLQVVENIIADTMLTLDGSFSFEQWLPEGASTITDGDEVVGFHGLPEDYWETAQ